jgi:hypothetical protein
VVKLPHDVDDVLEIVFRSRVARGDRENIFARAGVGWRWTWIRADSLLPGNKREGGIPLAKRRCRHKTEEETNGIFTIIVDKSDAGNQRAVVLSVLPFRIRERH